LKVARAIIVKTGKGRSLHDSQENPSMAGSPPEYHMDRLGHRMGDRAVLPVLAFTKPEVSTASGRTVKGDANLHHRSALGPHEAMGTFGTENVIVQIGNPLPARSRHVQIFYPVPDVI
jgi:hypothetical protein